METVEVQAIREFCVLRTKTEVRSFLGLTGYYRFISNYSSVTSPLTDQTRKCMPNQVVWAPECAAAFEKPKSWPCSVPVLQTLKNSLLCRRMLLSEEYMGVVLSQLDESGADHPVAYFSRKLLLRKQRYSTVEKECLAIKLSIQA